MSVNCRKELIVMHHINPIPENDDSDSYNVSGICITRTVDKIAEDNNDAEDLIMQSIKYSPYDDDVWMNESEAVALGKYDDFHTIDWARDRMRDRVRYRKFKKMKYQGTFWQKIKGFNDAWSGWLIVFLVGVCAGFVVGIIDIGADWMTDLKEGVCSKHFWFNKEACCWDTTNHFDAENCDSWKTWAEIVGFKSGNAHYALNYFFYVIAAVIFSILTAGLVSFFAPYACGSGIAQVKTILSGFVIKGYLGCWTLVIKTFTLITAVSTGLTLGQEGPIVHIAACIGNLCARLFPKYYNNEAKKREVISAACAAGVAVAFGAPIGGVLFSLEEVSYYFPLKTLWRTFFCALIAVLTLGYINPYGNGRLALFYANYTMPWKIFELLPFVLLGIFGGLYGAFFIKCNIWWYKFRKTTYLAKTPILEVLAVTIITAIIAFPNEYTRAPNIHMIALLFQNCGPEDGAGLCDYVYNTTSVKSISSGIYPHRTAGDGVYEAMWKLALAVIFKGIIVVFTFGLKVPAGIFIPSLYIGACTGRIVGIGMEQLVHSYPDVILWKDACAKSQGHCVVPGLYAMIGAAATLGGITRMTVSLVVIMFELTGGLSYIVPLMIAVMTCKWVGDGIGTDGIYNEIIRLNGYPYLDTKEEFTHTTLAADVMRPRRGGEPLTCIPKTGTNVGELERLLDETKFHGFPVIVDEQSQVLSGFVSRHDLKIAIYHGRLRNENIVTASHAYFSKKEHGNTQVASNGIPSLSLRHILDASPFTVTDVTPMEIVIDMFRKLGLRQVLVIHNGKLLGIITKKDVLRHIAEMKNMDPDSILFH